MSQSTSKLHHHQHHETHAQQQQAGAAAVLEFATADDMLRADAAATEVPPAVAGRLRESLEHEPRPASRWWQRLFGKSST